MRAMLIVTLLLLAGCGMPPRAILTVGSIIAVEAGVNYWAVKAAQAPTPDPTIRDVKITQETQRCIKGAGKCVDA